MLQFVAQFVSQFTHMTSLSAFSHLPFITGSNCSTSYCTRMSHWWVYQSVTSANGLFERFWHHTVKQEDRNNLFCMTLGTWRWDGEWAFSVWLSCTFTSMTMTLSVMHKSQGLIFFTLLPSPTHFSIISVKLPSFHTRSRLLTANLSVHMIINCYL